MCHEHIGSSIDKLVHHTSDSSTFLELVNSTWNEFCDQMLTIRSIFLYLDRTYVLQTPQLLGLWSMGLASFRAHLGSKGEIQRILVEGLLSLIEAERSGETVNHSLIKNILRMMSALGVYDEAFQVPFLEATVIFYSAESSRLMEASHIADYLLRVESRLRLESDRVVHYLESHTRRPLIAILENQFLVKHVHSIVSKGFDVLVDESRHDDLKRLYDLFGLREVNAHEVLVQSWRSYIKRRGLEIVMDAQKDPTMVQDLLDYKARLDKVLLLSFGNDEKFLHVVKDSFENFINCRENRPAELIAKFCDAKLRSSKTDDKLETVLESVLTLFRYINGKDVFEAFYKKDLAKRLIFNKCSSKEDEKFMITSLKRECGNSFTSKLEGMFKDIDTSEQLHVQFKSSRDHNENPCFSKIDLHVSILTTGYWPTYPPYILKIPREMEECQHAFQKFYLSNAGYTGRKLNWQYSLGDCVIKARFPHGTKELVVSLVQGIILLQFSGKSSLSFNDIKGLHGIADIESGNMSRATGASKANLQIQEMVKEELKRALLSLSVVKETKILKRESRGSKEIEGTDVFSVDTDFKSKKYRIKVNSVLLKETTAEQDATNEKVSHDRQYQIEACIVRIMKSRKTLTHPLLISELYSQLKFPVTPADLKKRIEGLIDRDYLERDEHNMSVYNYLA